MITGTVLEDAWSKALCCVYTHVVSGDVSEPVLTTYDGSRYRITGGSSVVAMLEAKKRICRMSMGRVDCEKQQGCIKEFLGQ